ncbi:helix-turn-helix transcriptional regulator [Streptomyces sp. DSM 42041]|uniref:Helix-turn-helix transcriptional regulator n=1 Tax=Streptomyces hazeniae TaxID=3075538 RepID=A0ABU2NYQ4_9ACTN|nr:helix-turn-helix transcriptional regulator [Streptomyces sp. DSM 42041]MDT0382125.1 helix-turn-helix transcriptional regulator [Streptomyces sp. DSM 42041]
MGRQAKPRATEEARPEAWRCYGRLLKLFREQKRLTQTELAEAAGYSYEHTASVEQGRRPAKLEFTEAMERVLPANGALLALQEEVELAKLPKFFQDFAKIEVEAVSRFEYEPQIVPGLLQTEAYARAVFGVHCPPLPPDVLEQHLEARLERQRLLSRAPVAQFSFVLWEPVLRNPVGDAPALRAQLHRLLEVTKLDNVEVQVIPARTGAHPGCHGPMVLLETHDHQRVGYLESQGLGSVITDAETVSAFSLRYGKLRSRALNIDESARLIERLAGEQ